MSADINDLITHVKLSTKTELAAPGYNTGDSSITCNDLSAWNTDDAVYFGIDQVNSLGVRIAGTYTEWKGIVSGSTIGSLDLINGNDQNYPAGSTTRVYQLITAAWADAIVDALLTKVLNKDGSIQDNAIATTNIADSAITTAKIADTGVSTAKVADNAVTNAKLEITPNSADANGWTTIELGTSLRISVKNIDMGNPGSIASSVVYNTGNSRPNNPVGFGTEVSFVRSVQVNTNSPYFNQTFESDTLYLRNESSGSVDPGEVYVQYLVIWTV
jgi:hypothetical protein